MEIGSARFVGARFDVSYTGKHREWEMPSGIGFIPLGDRSRDELKDGYLEERDSLDKYSKYYS